MGTLEIKKRQVKLNESLAEVLSNDKITSLKMTSIGNSIASGYSMTGIIKPLLFRNDSLLSVMEEHDIVLVRKHFARCQNNNDEHIAGWVIRNIKESDIHQMNRVDYGDGPTKMPRAVNSLSKDLIEEYYPVDIMDDKGLSDVISENHSKLANIVIYNGCTGSFLDNVTRGGKLSQKLTYGIKRDVKGLVTTLNYIQTNNRFNGTNTQIYICGAPNFLGLGISNFINCKLKKVAKNYANATYVEPVKSKFLYRKKDGKFPWLVPDVHYDEIEYLKFNNNIIESIINNYMINKSMIAMDRDLFRLNSDLELNNQFLGNVSYIQNCVLDSYNKQRDELLTNDQELVLCKRARVYLKERAPYDFYYIGKKNIDSVL